MFKKKKAPTNPEEYKKYNYHDTKVGNIQFVIIKQDQLERLENIYKAVQKIQPKWTKQDIMQFATSANNDKILNILLTFLEIQFDVPVKDNEEPNSR